MKKFASMLAALAALFATPALANLSVGNKAPAFSTATAKAGKAGRFSLAQALKRGPVVLYFYPKAFTKGCTLETRAFADAHDKFAAAGATIIGMSADDLGTLKRFSVEECRSKFAVGVATPAIIDAYDVALAGMGVTGVSNRTSYVIGRNGRIAFVHSDLDHREHVSKTLAAVQALKPKKR
jgi:thioredoxin-dependent peroxiredoxin